MKAQIDPRINQIYDFCNQLIVLAEQATQPPFHCREYRILEQSGRQVASTSSPDFQHNQKLATANLLAQSANASVAMARLTMRAITYMRGLNKREPSPMDYIEIQNQQAAILNDWHGVSL